MNLSKWALNVNETMEATGLGRTKIYQEIAGGRLKIAKCGRRTLITIEALQEFLKRLEDETAGAK
jgi:excisionase family DNA binding protein